MQPAAESPNDKDSVSDMNESYWPFIFKGLVTVTGKEEEHVQITILRDTRVTQSLMLDTLFPFSGDYFVDLMFFVREWKQAF